jgi:Tfp pilus tip-associated adhesin PilY1
MLLKLAGLLLLIATGFSMAAFDPVNDDTDIFLANPNIVAERPNVLIILDNTANWNTAFTNEKSALVSVVNGLSDQYNVGLMMFPETGGGNDNVDGGYVRYHVRQMTSQNKSALASMVNNLDKTADKGNNATLGLSMYEAYLYFAGLASKASYGKAKTDKDGTTDALLSPLTGHALPASPTASSLYRSPVVDGCQKNFIIYISNGPANENANARAALEGYLGTLTSTTPPATIAITPSGQQSNWADEMAKYLANADVHSATGTQNVYTYTVEVDPATSGGIITVTTAAAHGLSNGAAVTIAGTVKYNGAYTVSSVLSTTQFQINANFTPSPSTENTGTVAGFTITEINHSSSDMTALLKSMASNGKGKYFGVTSGASGTSIVDALNSIFTEVQSVNSVFASTTLPVSVNVRGTNLNQVYIGVFRPDSTKAPRWLGNLKMYNLALNSATNQVFLADASNGIPPATGISAENSTTGFVTGSATSFWTANSSFWSYRDASQNGVGGPSDRPDGDLVEKGGAAQQIRTAYPHAQAPVGSETLRRLYTCTTGSYAEQCAADKALRLMPFSTANTDIDAGSLNLDTRLVSPLSAYDTKPVTALTDRRTAILSNASAGASAVSSLNTGGTSATVTNLTTSTPKVITSLTASVQGTVTVNITSISKSGSTYDIVTASALSGVVNGSTVLTVSCTSGNTTFNSLTTANRTVSASNNTTRTYTIPGPSGNQSCTSGTITGPGPQNSTTAIATVAGHGYTSGQSVTIAGATPSQFNTTSSGITVIDTDNFSYTITPAAGTAAAAVSGVSMTAAGNTTTATATTSAAHGFTAGNTVNVSGASNAAYNGNKVLLTASGSTFTYSVGTTAIAANTATPVYAVKGGSTTATVTTSAPHVFVNGQTVTISNSDVTGYNGSFVISGVTSTSFQYTVAAVLPANTSTSATASTGTVAVVTVTAANHGFSIADSVIIESSTSPADANHPGTYTVVTVPTANTFTYATGSALAAPTGSFTVRPPTLSSKAIATVTAHGYAVSDQVLISGASPSGYNGTVTITRIVDANTFEYALASTPGPNTGSTVQSSKKTTNARATSVGHGFTNGSSVQIANATPSAFNGTFTVTLVDANTFSYTLGSAQGDADGTITASQAGTGSAERTALINWVRGQDNISDENSNASSVDIRASVHGDVLHSRPAVINYNRFGSDNDVYIYYGANDGVFHAIKGGYATDAADTDAIAPGYEAWGFIPTEFFSSFKRMRNNSPSVSSSFKKPYFADGPMGIYTKDANNNTKFGDSGDKVNLYIAMRRGGRMIYALDVNTPTDPKYLWKINNTTTGFSELGQTWSQPTVVTGLNGFGAGPVLIFGAGYDAAVEDLSPVAITASTATTVTTAAGTVTRSMGRGIYVVNALTGALVWSAGPVGSGATLEVAGMDYAIPSDLTIIKNESGGATNRAYVGDTGGNLWRIDFKGTNLATTTVTKLASVGGSGAVKRKFLFPPDVVGQSGFDAVLMGAGDREHPFDTAVTNRMYMFKDYGNDTGPLTGTDVSHPTIIESAMFDSTSNCIQDVSGCASGVTQADAKAALGAASGWYLTLNSGEKVVGNAVSIASTTFFNTNQPSATAGGGTCGSNLGVARQYQVGTADATATTDINATGGLTGADRSLVHPGGGYLPSPVHVVVNLGGKPVEAVISGIQVSTPAGATLNSRLRKYWYKEIE